ncbi:MAG: T9SS type A sorting domain-containing protein [Melioribacteraceae bacterium]|nr:T9SS type A sorting domain-containing protein [Melioribacteraceae bacterium]
MNQEDKSAQSEDQPDGWVNSVRDLDALAKKFELSQNYPNPFNPSTVIKFAIPQTSEVSLKVYNVLGQEVKTLINTEMNAGSYEVKFNASQLASGIYFYSIQAGDFTATKKMMLLK